MHEACGVVVESSRHGLGGLNYKDPLYKSSLRETRAADKAVLALRKFNLDIDLFRQRNRHCYHLSQLESIIFDAPTFWILISPTSIFRLRRKFGARQIESKSSEIRLHGYNVSVQLRIR